MNAQESVRQTYYVSHRPGLYDDYRRVTIKIWAYHGDPSKNPGWARDSNGTHLNLLPQISAYSLTLIIPLTGKKNPGFEKLCVIEADLSGMKNALTQEQGVDGPFNTMEFCIAIQLGGTELCARIEWVENVSCMGVLCSTPIGIDIDCF